METPRTDKFFNVGQEWRGVPSPRESVIFCRSLEAEIENLKSKDSQLSQMLSIANQIISDQRSRIDMLETERFAAGGGTVAQASTKLPSAPGGNACPTCGGVITDDCIMCGAPQCCSACCRLTTMEIIRDTHHCKCLGRLESDSESQSCGLCDKPFIQPNVRSMTTATEQYHGK